MIITRRCVLMNFNESDLEAAIIEKFKQKKYEYGNDQDPWFIERELSDFVNKDLLFKQLKSINPNISVNLIEDAIYSILNINNTNLFERNRIFHKYLPEGVTVETGNDESNPTIKLIDFEKVENNLFEVANQIKFNEKGQTRIPDVLIYINGLPLVAFELKSPEYSKYCLKLAVFSKK